MAGSAKAVWARLGIGAATACTAGLAYVGFFEGPAGLRIAGALGLAAGLAATVRLADPARSLASTAGTAALLAAAPAGEVLLMGGGLDLDRDEHTALALLLAIAVALPAVALSRPPREGEARAPLERRLLQALRGFAPVLALGGMSGFAYVLVSEAVARRAAPLAAAALLGAGAALGLDYAARAPEGLPLSRFDSLSTARGASRGGALAPLWARILLGGAAGVLAALLRHALPLGEDARMALALVVGIAGAALAIELDRPRPRARAALGTALVAAFGAWVAACVVTGRDAPAFYPYAAAVLGAAARCALAWREDAGGAPPGTALEGLLATFAGMVRAALGTLGAGIAVFAIGAAIASELTPYDDQTLAQVLGASMGAAAVVGWTWAEVSVRAAKRRAAEAKAARAAGGAGGG